MGGPLGLQGVFAEFGGPFGATGHRVYRQVTGMAVTMSFIAFFWSALGYGGMRGSAEEIRNLGQFLEGYLGDCDSPEPAFDKRGCLRAVRKKQKRYRGKLLVLGVDEPAEQLRLAQWDDAKRAYRLHLTPFFSERGLALSVGAPKRMNRQGFPMVRNIPIWVKQPSGKPRFGFRRALERGMVRLELLVKPLRPWRLRQKRTKDVVRGLAVRLMGVRIYGSRGGDILSEQVY